MKSFTSIYPDSTVQAEVMARYDQLLAGWPVAHESVVVRTDFGTVHAVAAGPAGAPVVLLLPAGSMSAAMWGSTAAALSLQFRVYAIDPLGDVGRSVLDDLRRYPRTGAELARLYVQVADALGAGTVHLVGNSIGGYTAALVAAHAPDRVGRVVLICPMGLTGTAHLLPLLWWSVLPGRAARERRLRWICRGDPDTVARVEPWMRSVADVRARMPRLGRLPARRPDAAHRPTLVLLGEHDHFVGRADRAASRARRIPGAQVVVLACGHTPTLECPQTIDPQILDFLLQDGAPKDN